MVLRVNAHSKKVWRRDYSNAAADFGNSGNNHSGSRLRRLPKQSARLWVV
jgi:hypothetical protein